MKGRSYGASMASTTLAAATVLPRPLPFGSIGKLAAKTNSRLPSVASSSASLLVMSYPHPSSATPEQLSSSAAVRSLTLVSSSQQLAPTIEQAPTGSKMEILPIPMIGSGFLVLCMGVLFVSLYYHFRSADRRHISWLRTKPLPITALSASGPGLVLVVADNYEYTCSQLKHRDLDNLPIDGNNKQPENQATADPTPHDPSSPTKHVSFPGSSGLTRILSLRKSRLFQRRKTSVHVRQLIEAGLISMKNFKAADDDDDDDDGDGDSQHVAGSGLQFRNAESITVPMVSAIKNHHRLTNYGSNDQSQSRSDLLTPVTPVTPTTRLLMCDGDDVDGISAEMRTICRLESATNSSLCSASHLPHQTSCASASFALDLPPDLDASYWSYTSVPTIAAVIDHRRPSVSSGSPLNKSVDQGVEGGGGGGGQCQGQAQSCNASPRPERRRAKLSHQHQQYQSVDSRMSIVSSTGSALSNLQVPTGRSPVVRQHSLRMIDSSSANSSDSTALMPRGKTYTGLLSLTRLHNMIQTRLDQASAQAPCPHQHPHPHPPPISNRKHGSMPTHSYSVPQQHQQQPYTQPATPVGNYPPATPTVITASMSSVASHSSATVSTTHLLLNKTNSNSRNYQTNTAL